MIFYYINILFPFFQNIKKRPISIENNLSSSLYKSYEEHLIQVGNILNDEYKNIFVLALEETLINDIKHLVRRIALGHNDENRVKARFIALNNSKLTKKFSSIKTPVPNAPYETLSFFPSPTVLLSFHAPSTRLSE